MHLQVGFANKKKAALLGGTCEVLGHRIPSRAARARVGFLPEHPYFYDYLTVTELLDLVGRLHGLPVPLQTLLMTAIIVPLMAWVHMPLLTRLFRAWLAPR